MIGSELFDTTPILIKIRYIKTSVEFRMSSEKKQPVSRNKIIEQFLHNTDCFSSCAARSRQRMKSEFSKQLKCFTPGKVGTKARGRASREKVGVIESVEIFGQNRVPSRFFPRLLFFLQFFLFLSRSSLLLGVVHSLNKRNFALELFVTMIDITFVIAMMMFFKKEILSRKTVTSSWIFFARLRKES